MDRDDCHLVSKLSKYYREIGFTFIHIVSLDQCHFVKSARNSSTLEILKWSNRRMKTQKPLQPLLDKPISTKWLSMSLFVDGANLICNPLKQSKVKVLNICLPLVTTAEVFIINLAEIEIIELIFVKRRWIYSKFIMHPSSWYHFVVATSKITVNRVSDENLLEIAAVPPKSLISNWLFRNVASHSMMGIC